MLPVQLFHITITTFETLNLEDSTPIYTQVTANNLEKLCELLVIACD